MPRYAALIRGINVGGKQKLPMESLRQVLGGLGHTGVRTYLQSGNAVFTSSVTDEPQLERDLEAAIASQAGLTVRCLVRERADLWEVINGNPLAQVATEGKRYLALFLSASPDPVLLAEHDPIALDPPNVRLGSRVIYQWCPAGFMAAAPVGTYVEKKLKVAVTSRNWNTVTKLGELIDS